MILPFHYEENKRFIAYNKPPIDSVDALQKELENFVRSIQGKETPIVSGKAGKDALEVAMKIQQMILEDLH